MGDQQLHYDEDGTHVLVKNEATGGVWWSPVDYHARTGHLLGWEPTTPDESPDLTGLVDSEPEQTGFDPSAPGVTADQVSEHLALHAESAPGEVERVLGLERAGKNRKSVVVPEGFDPITGD